MRQSLNRQVPGATQIRWRRLKEHARLGDQVVIVGVEAGRGDLHAGVDDEKWMLRFPILRPDNIERRGKNEVLHLAVVAAREIKRCIVLDLEPRVRSGVRLRHGIPADGSSLEIDFARGQRAAKRGNDIEATAEGIACGDGRAVGVRGRAVFVASRREAVT